MPINPVKEHPISTTRYFSLRKIHAKKPVQIGYEKTKETASEIIKLLKAYI